MTADRPEPRSTVPQSDASAREAATREILEVISRSRDDHAPVFQAILRNACGLCDVPFAGLYLVNNARSHASLVASLGTGKEYLERALMEWSLDSQASVPQAIVGNQMVHIADLADTDAYRAGDRQRVEAVDIEGIRTFLAIPLSRDGVAVGCLGLYRREVRPFTEEQIALGGTFAAQAVIAVENVRQFRELQTRLEREAATREILEVISRSREDERPVFDAILENASRLCRAPLAFLPMVNVERTHVSVPAFRGIRPEFEEVLTQFNEPLSNTGLVAVRCVAEGRIVQSDDLSSEPAPPQASRWRHELTQTEGARSVLVVPMMQAGVAVGAIMLYRREVAPFSDEDIALVQTFAAQAVIAIENVRQFKALEARTEEVQALNASLEERVKSQVGEIERMSRLKRFLSPAVADAVVSSGSDTLLGSHRALIATLFCDIRGFTAFCETAEPEETIEVLQTYHEEMGALIVAHGGGVDHRSGDGIMVIFNDPLPCDDPAGDALRMALAMRERMRELCTRWKRLGHRLGFGVGISLGYATVGMVGSEGRYDYTASGTAVNLAARLCDEAEDGDILLSPRAYMAVEDAVSAEPIGELSLKGIQAPVQAYRVIAT